MTEVAESKSLLFADSNWTPSQPIVGFRSGEAAPCTMLRSFDGSTSEVVVVQPKLVPAPPKEAPTHDSHADRVPRPLVEAPSHSQPEPGPSAIYGLLRMLHESLATYRWEFARKLVAELGAEPGAIFECLTALHRVAADGNLDLVRFFTLGCGVDPMVPDSNGLPPVLYAVRHPSVVKFFVDELRCDPRVQYSSYGSLLQRAIHENCPETVKYLVMDCRVSMSKPTDQIVVDYAASEGNVPLLRFLLCEAKLSAVDLLRPRVAIVRHLSIIELLFVELALPMDQIRNDTGFRFVDIAALQSCFEALKYFIEVIQIPVHSICPFKEATLLHLAAGGGNMEGVQYLVETCHADLYICDSEGCPPVLWASVHPPVMEFILNHRMFNVDHRYSGGTFLIQKAAAAGMLALTKALVPKCRSRSLLERSLSGAIIYGQLETTRYLHDECGIPVATRRWVASTLQIAKYFIEEKGLDPQRECVFGWTFFLSTCLTGSAEVLNYLLKVRKVVVPIAQYVLGVMLLVGRDTNCKSIILDLYSQIPSQTWPIPVEAIDVICSNAEIRGKYVQAAIAVITHELDLESAVGRYLTSAQRSVATRHHSAEQPQHSSQLQKNSPQQQQQQQQQQQHSHPQQSSRRHITPALLELFAHAAQHGDLAVVQYLVETCGIDPNIRLDVAERRAR